MDRQCITRRIIKVAAWSLGGVLAILLAGVAVFYGWTWATTRPESLEFHPDWTARERESIRLVYGDYARIVRSGGEDFHDKTNSECRAIDSEGNEVSVDLSDHSWWEKAARRYMYWKKLRPTLQMIERTAETGDARRRAEDGSTLLLAAASMRRYELIKPLLAHGADPNARTLPSTDRSSSLGDTPLNWVLSSWSPGRLPQPSADETMEAMRLLIDAGADVNAASSIASAPLLQFAVWLPDGEKIAHFMLDRGARPLVAESGMRFSLLARAITYRWPSVVKRLLDSGIDPNDRTLPAYPIQLCCPAWREPAPEKDREILLDLLAHGADPDLYGYRDVDGSTGDSWETAEKGEDSVLVRDYFKPLLAALCDDCSLHEGEEGERDRQSRILLAGILLARGANPDIRPVERETQGTKLPGKTPLMICIDTMRHRPEAAAWSLEMMRLLLRHGADATFSYLTPEERDRMKRSLAALPDSVRGEVTRLLPNAGQEAGDRASL